MLTRLDVLHVEGSFTSPPKPAPKVFTCRRCGRPVPWSQGAADDWPDWCDACVAQELARPHPHGQDGRFVQR